MYDYEKEKDECLVCLYDNGKIYYTIVERDPELRYTGLSIINRILADRHRFIGDFYATQSYFSVVYIDDDNIKVNKDLAGSDRNEMTLKELDEYLFDDRFPYIYVYDVKKDMLIIKEPNKELYFLEFYDRAKVDEFIEQIQ